MCCSQNTFQLGMHSIDLDPFKFLGIYFSIYIFQNHMELPGIDQYIKCNFLSLNKFGNLVDSLIN